jgi:hypothetical protein
MSRSMSLVASYILAAASVLIALFVVVSFCLDSGLAYAQEQFAFKASKRRGTGDLGGEETISITDAADSSTNRNLSAPSIGGYGRIVSAPSTSPCFVSQNPV